MPAKRRASAKRKVATTKPGEGKVEVRTPNVPGYSGRVDAAKYAAMKRTLLAVLPKRAPGLTQAEMFDAAAAEASAHGFPAGTPVAWWAKCVQLDLEARGLVRREPTKPARWRRA